MPNDWHVKWLSKIPYLHLHHFTHMSLGTHLFAVIINSVYSFLLIWQSYNWLLMSYIPIIALYHLYFNPFFVCPSYPFCLFKQLWRSGAAFNGSWNSNSLLMTHCDFHLSPFHPICSLCPSLPLFFALFSAMREVCRQKLSEWAVSFPLAVFTLSCLYLLSWLPRKVCVVCLS